MGAENTSLILWIDLRYSKNVPVIGLSLSEKYQVSVITSGDDINYEISKSQPDIICFDYDLPDQVGLSVLSEIKCKNPSIPFIMLTEDHSTDLAIWALRSRAWDYFVKPLNINEFSSSISMLLERMSCNSEGNRDNFMLQPQVPSEARPYKSKSNTLSTIHAVNYVQQNLSNKISVECVAKLCGMSKSHFSRTFKKEHGTTFQEFLIQQRMNKAVELLKNSDFLVTQVALAVGYCELSNFTSAFQRLIGIRPSSFRKALLSKRENVKSLTL